MLSEAGLEAVAKVIDPDMWSADAENYLDAFERKPHDKGRYWDFVTKHGELAVGVRREAAREKAQAAITAYLASVQGEPTAFLIERLAGDGYGSPRSIVDAAKYDPRRDDFWVGDAKTRHLVTPLYAATHPADRDSVEAGGWRLITDDDRPPNDTDVLMGCWQRWPDDKWLVEYGLYGSTKGGWIHGRMTHWLPSSILPSPPVSTKGGE